MQRKFSLKLISYSLLLCIFFTSITSSYISANTVNAVASDEEMEELVKDTILLALTVASVAFVPELSIPAALTALYEGYLLGNDIDSYILDNGDGTATISSDTIQMILDSSAYHIAEDGFGDSDVINYDSSYNHNYYAYIKGLDGNGDSCLMSAKGSSNIFIAGKFDIDSDNLYTIFGTIDFTNIRSVGIPASLYRSGNLYKNFALGGTRGYGVYAPSEYCANFPIFKTNDELTNFLTTGEGYQDALNYNPDKVDKLRYGTNYSPTYAGGDVTVNLNRLNNFTAFYEQTINNDYDTDTTLNILTQYILDLSEPETETSETETESEIESDTTPPGDSISDSNNWLKKIYNRIGSFMTQVKQTGDDIIKQLKAIKRWSAIDAVFDGVDAVADWLQFLKSLFDDVGGGVAVLASGFADTASLITQKFPFSIPWDIAFLIAFLADTPDTPVFDIPIKLDAYCIDQTLTIDFSQFSAVSRVSRMLLTMIYIVGLLKLTSKIISNKKGG